MEKALGLKRQKPKGSWQNAHNEPRDRAGNGYFSKTESEFESN